MPGRLTISSAGTVYIVDYNGGIYRFNLTALIQLGSGDPSTFSAHALKVAPDGTFYFRAGDPDIGDFTLWRSVDGSTVEMLSQPVDPNVTFVSLNYFDIAPDGTIWSIWGLDNSQAVYKSTDGGNTQQFVIEFIGDRFTELNRIACHRTNPDLVAVSFTDGDSGPSILDQWLYATSNAGGSWATYKLTHGAGFAPSLEPNYVLKFAGDSIVFLMPGFTTVQDELISVVADATLSSVTENEIIQGGVSPGGLTAWYGAAFDQNDPDVVVFMGWDDSGNFWWWRSADGGLSFDKIAYTISATYFPCGYFFLSGTLYVVINKGPGIEVWRISNPKTASSFAAEMIFTDEVADLRDAVDDVAVVV